MRRLISKGYNKSGKFFHIVAISDLVHDVEAIYSLP